MTRLQTIYNKYFLQRGQTQGAVTAKLDKCNGPEKRFNKVPLMFCLYRNYLEPGNRLYYIMLNLPLFWPLPLLPGLTHL